MRKIILCLACAMLLTGAGCTARGEKAPEAAPTPEVTAPPVTPEPTPTPTPEPTPTPTPEPTPMPLTPPETAWVRGEEPEEYTLLTGTSAGAAALGAWLRSEGADAAGTYAPRGMEEPMFTLLFTRPEGETKIAAAEDGAEPVRLATDERMVRSGLLSALLPVFERNYGYTVEVLTGDPEDLKSWAGSAAADVALLTEADVSALGRRGFAGVEAYVSTVYTMGQ